jgi:hypothetical protein
MVMSGRLGRASGVFLLWLVFLIVMVRAIFT